MYAQQSSQNMDKNHALNKFLNDEVKLNRKKTSKTVQAITNTVQQIVQFVNSKDKRFQKEVKCTGSYYQGLKVNRADEFDFNIYLDGFDQICNWGSGDPPRLYRFNKDYDREFKIFVQTHWQFVMPPIYMPMTALPYQSSQQMGMHLQTNHPKRPVDFYSTAMTPTSRNYDPMVEHQRNVQMSRGIPMEVSYPNKMPISARQTFALAQGPVLPPGHSVDTDNLETLPDDMEIIRSKTALPSPPLGYCHFGLVPSTWKNPNDFVYDGDVIPFYVQRRFKKLLEQALRELPDFRGNVRLARKVHGPALTLRVPTQEADMPEISVDFAVALPTKLPHISSISDWPRLGKRWPSKAKIEAIKTAGINFVAKKPYYWSRSFSPWEKELINGIDKSGEECRKDCHRIMKRVREKFWCTTTKPVVSSYHLKNILFWECEDYPESAHWKQDKIWERFESMTNRLLRYIETRNLPQYFNSKMNLLEGKNQETLKLEKSNIVEFMRDPIRLLSK